MNDRRLIEDYLPIEDISAESSREKSLRHGHISTIHLWWARRPLVACRAAVYASLVPAPSTPNGRGPKSDFVKRLCKYPGDPKTIETARQHIREAHRERTGSDKPPKVLDCFAGGGSIPLEALRLGCDAYALELNPVAHIIELCTLVYPQKFGKPDPNAVGCDNGKWAGLAKEVEHWGKWVLKHVKEEIGDLYPPIPDPAFRNKQKENSSTGFQPVQGIKRAQDGSTGFQPVQGIKRAQDGSTGFQPVHFSSQPVQQELFKTRRNLPHWQMGGSTYFVTFRTQSVKLTPEARKLVLDACLHFNGSRYNLWAAVVMPDHVHLLIQPKEIENGKWHSLSVILHSIKSFTANKVNALLDRRGILWQDESFDRIVRDENEFYEKWNYIRNNPVKNGLTNSTENWIGFYQCTGEVCTGKMPVPPVKQVSVEQASSLLESDNAQAGCLCYQQGYLTPVAYLWTRTVPCKNPNCDAIVPLVRQTWLCNKSGRFIALKVTPDRLTMKPAFTVVQSSHRLQRDAVAEFGFDPGNFSSRGNATCIFCGTVADSEYVKHESQAGRLGRQLTGVICTRTGETGKIYFGASDMPEYMIPDDEAIEEHTYKLCNETGFTMPEEPMDTEDPTTVAGRGFGISKWFELFTNRQLLTLLTFTKWTLKAHEETACISYLNDYRKAIITTLGLWVDRIANQGNSFCVYHTSRETIENAVGAHVLPMVWDFVESNPLGSVTASAISQLGWIVKVLNQECKNNDFYVKTGRGSATTLPYDNTYFDAIVTDPPYYDNISYATLSDFFYVWLKRCIGNLYPEHFASELTPKRNELIADNRRHGGIEGAKRFYETMMLNSLKEMYRVLKIEGILTMVYAHKTVAGWSTLVNALRQAGFVVIQSWPFETEMQAGKVKTGKAMLASSIFLTVRKRDANKQLGDYTLVRSELEDIVRERVKTLWSEGISGADLIIACVGAGLKAYTQYERVEFPNGEEVSSERFLSEVEGMVQETILEYLFGSRTKISTLDAPTRFYILWRYAYSRGEIDAGEAIVFSYPLGVELDGPQGLSTGRLALLGKKGSKYRLRDFTERGEDEDLGIDSRFGILQPPMIDVLHRLLWLMENRTLSITEFLGQAMPKTEEIRLLAQGLSGSALQGSGLRLTTDAEESALRKLVQNWDSVVEDGLFRRR